jgi:hypothetical protein
MFGDLQTGALRWRAEVLVLIDKMLAGPLKMSGCCGEEGNLMKQFFFWGGRVRDSPLYALAYLKISLHRSLSCAFFHHAFTSKVLRSFSIESLLHIIKK